MAPASFESRRLDRPGGGLACNPTQTPRSPGGAPPRRSSCKASASRFKERCSTGQSVRDQHGRDESPYDTTPPDCVVFPTTSAEVAEVVRMCARHRVPVIAYGAGTSIEGHIMAVEGGVTDRPVPDEQGPRGERGGPDRDRRGRGDPQAVECGDRGHRALLPRRPGRGRHARRHGRHPRVGLQRRPLRHDARERPRPEGRHGRRRGHPHGPPREEVLGGVRPHADLRRERGDARHHHRGHRPALPPARGRVGRGLPLPGRRGRGGHGHPDDPAGRPDRARRAARRADRHRGQPLQQDGR